MYVISRSVAPCWNVCILSIWSRMLSDDYDGGELEGLCLICIDE